MHFSEDDVEGVICVCMLWHVDAALTNTIWCCTDPHRCKNKHLWLSVDVQPGQTSMALAGYLI